MAGKFITAPASRWKWALASLVMLAPCYWQPRLQGGDLSSRMYNAWLTQWMENGRSEGFLVIRQTTNILFDLLMAGLFRVFNAEFAQRIAVSIAVLTFVWGAFAFVSVVSGRRPWHLLSCIAILAYGWVFHMGFFSFYLSLGLCFWMLSLLWKPTRGRIAAALPLAVLAYAAHLLPLIWSLGLFLYVWMARRVSQSMRAYLTAGSVVAMLAFHIWVGRAWFTEFGPMRLQIGSGSEQLWLFDAKYYLVLAGLLLAWGVMFLEIVRDSGARRVLAGIPFQICVISALGVVMLPTTLLIPGLNHTTIYIAERMSLGVGICLCALLGSAKPRMVVRYSLLVVALVFFGFLYGDERKQNSYEDFQQDTVAYLSTGPAIAPAGL